MNESSWDSGPRVVRSRRNLESERDRAEAMSAGLSAQRTDLFSARIATRAIVSAGCKRRSEAETGGDSGSAACARVAAPPNPASTQHHSTELHTLTYAVLFVLCRGVGQSRGNAHRQGSWTLFSLDSSLMLCCTHTTPAHSTLAQHCPVMSDEAEIKSGVEAAAAEAQTLISQSDPAHSLRQHRDWDSTRPRYARRCRSLAAVCICVC